VLLFELTGKTSGAEESQVTEFVRSLTNGADANVPTARKFPVSCKLPTVIALGMMVSESKLPTPAPPPEEEADTVRVALELTGPLKAVAFATIVDVPAATAVTSPDVSTLATAGLLEAQVTPPVIVWVVGCFALPNVPMTLNCVV
jgi:hypothetical protein